MTLKRSWWFVQEKKIEGHDGPDDAVYVYVTQPSLTGPSRHKGIRLRKYGKRTGEKSSDIDCCPLKKLEVSTITDERKAPGVKLVFYGRDRPIVFFKPQFEWNRNDFSRQFSELDTANFVTKFNELLKSETNTDGQQSICESLSDDSSFEDAQIQWPSPQSSSSQISEDSESIDGHTSETSGSRKRNRKRRSIESLEVPNLVKQHKKTTTADPMKVELSDCKIGLHKIHISNLAVGTNRELDDEFVDFLVKKMEEFTDDSYQPYCVLIKNVTKDEFKAENVNGYKYKIIGGQHNFKAACIMAERHQEDNLFRSRLCTVYAGLTMQQELFLMKQHNDVAGYIHKFSLKDKVRLARLRKSVEMNRSEWMNECKKMLNENRSDVNAICALAELPEDAYNLFGKVVKLHEEGRLKDQRLSKKERMQKPDIKTYIFRDLVSLNIETIKTQLDHLITNVLSLTEFMTENSLLKNLATVQRHFISQLGLQSWEEVVKMYPNYASREYLKRYIHLSFKNGTPEVLVQACNAMRETQKGAEISEESNLTHESFMGLKCSKSYAVLLAPQEINMTEIKKITPDFTGATLFFLNMPQVWNEEDLTNFATAIRSMSLDGGIPYYTLVIPTPMPQMNKIQSILRTTEMFTKVEDLYYFIENTKTASNTFWKSVNGAVVAYWSSSGRVAENQLNFNGQPKHNLINVHQDNPVTDEDGSIIDENQRPVELLEKLISLFTRTGDWLIEVASSTGSALVASLKQGRRCLAFEEDSHKFNVILQRATKEESDLAVGSLEGDQLESLEECDDQ